MAGGNNPKPSPKNPPPQPSSSAAASKPGATSSKPTHKPQSNRTPPKPTSNPNPNPNRPLQPDPVPPPGAPFAHLRPGLPPPPSYDFHMLDRRTIVLADGSVRSYFALPPDYQDFTPVSGARWAELGGKSPLGPMSPDGFGRGRSQDYWNSLGLDGRGGALPEGSMKRKFGGEGEERERVDGRDVFARQRQQLLQYANAGAGLGPGTSSPLGKEDEVNNRATKHMRVGGGGFDNVGVRSDVDPVAVKKAFLNFVKVINESGHQKKIYLENGMNGLVQCLACGRSAKDFPDTHSLVMHTYNSDNAALRIEHLGLHKALCVLMGWNYMRPPDGSKAYQFLPADQAAANQDDLIMWPPTVIIHNTNTGKGKDGRMEGLGNKAMDAKLRELGFTGGKSKALYSREGHLGISVIKFSADQSGLKEALRLTDYFERDRHGRKDWARAQSLLSTDENNPNLVKVDERTGEKKRVLYGYLGTASDLEKLDFEMRKKAIIESKREHLGLPSGFRQR